jgi:type IV secretion system protein VirB10
VTGVLAIAFISLVAIGFLAWYYGYEWRNRHAARDRAVAVAQQRAQGEMRLPPLPRIQAPRAKPTTERVDNTSLWGDPPPPPPSGPVAPLAYRPQAAKATAALVDRRLTGPVLSEDDESSTSSQTSAREASRSAPHDVMPATLHAATSATDGGESLANLLRPTVTPATVAGVLPTQRLLLPKGWKIDCTLETAIDSSLPGLVTCVTPTDIFGADGTTVLLERGTQLTGETRNQARQGLARVFVLWTEARTPNGIVASLESPGTDELGRSGLPGQVQRHFFERFGAAILVSVIEGAIQRAARPSGGNTVILNPTASGSVATEVLKSTVNVPPTILKHNGDRIQIMVARDIDFRSVYELRPTAAHR